MKQRNTIFVLLAVLALLGVGFGVVQMRRHAAAVEAQRAADLEKARLQAAAPVPTRPPSPNNPRPSNKQWQDPEARTALALVGADAISEQYWATAINNPDLPAKERQDLIEDLNEEGISDPKHPTANDLKMIKNRIKIIEELSPQAMDDVNAAAFKEAHKDLTEMLNRPAR